MALRERELPGPDAAAGQAGGTSSAAAVSVLRPLNALTHGTGIAGRRRTSHSAGLRRVSAGEGEGAAGTAARGPSSVNSILTENWQLLMRGIDLFFPSQHPSSS